MNAQFSHAEDTAALLLQGERSGSRVMIPGAFEKRSSASAGPVVHNTEEQPTHNANGADVSDRERLVYEREGGGAPSERSGGRARAFFGRLWRSQRQS